MIRPFVLINMAMTADGKIASANRAVTKLGSRRDFGHLLSLRATVDAVMTGAGTINAQPDITLGPGSRQYSEIRAARGLSDAPLRILASGSGRLNPKAKIFRSPGAPIIVLTTKQMHRARRHTLAETAAEVCEFGRSKIDMRKALNWLRVENGVKRLLCEGGGQLNGTLLAAGLVDEINLTICPKIMSGKSAPTIADSPIAESLMDARQFKLKSMRPASGEVFLVYRTD
ncbi:MAG: diaminohydroxyphosphoribosylaminopyrimidine reductase [Verrucomicrobiales bacterium]|nr:diaminohydroxyphosphoribosylaminopyrimidine reductase [Verrucomicrobiales bacterium]